MRANYGSLALAALLLAGCGGGSSTSSWFSREPEIERLEPAPDFYVLEARQLMPTIDKVTRDKVPGGVILRATGLPPSEGYWEPGLVPLNDMEPVDGVISFEFRVAPPRVPNPPGRANTRRVLAAHFVSDIALEGVTSLRVVGESNSRSIRP